MSAKNGRSVCDAYCRGCIYCFDYGSGGFVMCEYAIQTGERRPCKAGEGCTVRVKRKYTGKTRAKKLDRPVPDVPKGKQEKIAVDKLEVDMRASEEAGFGVSYGLWRASLPEQEVNTGEIPEGWRVCQYCGKAYKPKQRRLTKYCSPECKEISWNETKKIRQREQRRLKAEAL